ncbi:AAA family ATPase [Pseudomonas sp. TUM22785]|uniref:AAA family ATPase n=1 Tax=Pseudomonas sp. TUM22785 TaxID=3019098 RepID=UPI002306C62C|nr:AAA family ATPase [Pseudomonas sp. TUM22785]WCD83004.1 AAA family ATPase [Pseudomonas sp. TUM22785]
MAIIQEILKWSKDLSAWQQDAIARLYSDRTLSPDDLDDLLALAKAEVGIPDPKGRVPKKLNDAEIAPKAALNHQVKLVAVKNLVNVNAIAPDVRLPIAVDGVTVIYGENGAGKSGYSRVFKHACRARDRREQILPDAKLDKKAVGKAEALFEVQVENVVHDLAWRFGEEASELLASISIFDAHCARAYIDNHGDFAFVPYGLDILESLAGACKKLKESVNQEMAARAPSDAAYSVLAQEPTAVGIALRGIPGKTTARDIDVLAVLTQQDADRLIFLKKTLAEVDPKQKAQALRQKAARFEGLNSRLQLSLAIISADKVLELQALIDRSNAAKKAMELAAAEFQGTALEGTGGEAWKDLFKYAREFAKISHADHEFPKLSSSSLCPLCQNPLGDEGVQRLVRFDEFVERSVEKAAKEARDTAAVAFKTIRDATLDILLDDALKEELAEVNQQLLEYYVEIQHGLKTRQESIIRAAGGGIPWDGVFALQKETDASVASVAKDLIAQAVALEAAADEKAKLQMVKECAELESKKKLIDVKEAVLENIGKHSYRDKLQACLGTMDTGGISRKSTDLSRDIASQELADALNDELKRLKVNQLKVAMRPVTSAGRVSYKLTLELPGGGNPAAILSEGEQKAISLASFLAEIKLSGGGGGVVFDDPVSSLDHRRRWEVAERLAAEAKERQVIVFTHDIYFLCILEQHAKELGVPFTSNYIRRTSAGFGVHSDRMPFDLLGTKGRIGMLREMMNDVRQAAKVGDEDLQRSLTAAVYGKLRHAWERCVEEVLLNSAVQRFNEGVSTKNLRSVTVTNEDYKSINEGMTKCSKFEHDSAMRIERLPIPHPDEVREDIEKLDTWRNAVLARQKTLQAERP